MVEIWRSGDPVLLSFLRALLADGGVRCEVFDAHVSAVEGRIGAFPCRLMVAAEAAEHARSILREAGFEAAAP